MPSPASSAPLASVLAPRPPAAPSEASRVLPRAPRTRSGASPAHSLVSYCRYLVRLHAPAVAVAPDAADLVVGDGAFLARTAPRQWARRGRRRALRPLGYGRRRWPPLTTPSTSSSKSLPPTASTPWSLAPVSVSVTAASSASRKAE